MLQGALSHSQLYVGSNNGKVPSSATDVFYVRLATRTSATIVFYGCAVGTVVGTVIFCVGTVGTVVVSSGSLIYNNSSYGSYIKNNGSYNGSYSAVEWDCNTKKQEPSRGPKQYAVAKHNTMCKGPDPMWGSRRVAPVWSWTFAGGSYSGLVEIPCILPCGLIANCENKKQPFATLQLEQASAVQK